MLLVIWLQMKNCQKLSVTMVWWATGLGIASATSSRTYF